MKVITSTFFTLLSFIIGISPCYSEYDYTWNSSGEFTQGQADSILVVADNISLRQKTVIEHSADLLLNGDWVSGLANSTQIQTQNNQSVVGLGTGGMSLAKKIRIKKI